jgi:hypothetical protein
LQAVDPWHHQIGDQDRRLPPLDEFDRLAPIGRFTDHFKQRIRFQ